MFASVAILLVSVWGWQTVLDSAQERFAFDYIEVFYQMKTQANTGQVTPDEAVSYIESYYPSGTKLAENSNLGRAIERVRFEVISEIKEQHNKANIARP